MSKRESVLCDKDNCNTQAVGKCALCDKDVCDIHTLCEQGGLVLSVEMRQLASNIPRKPPRGQTSPPPQFERYGDSNQTFVVVCDGCARRLTVSNTSNGYKAPYVRALPAVMKYVIETLRAALAEDAMAAKNT